MVVQKDRPILAFFILVLVVFSSCKSGKIPCPDFGSKNKFSLFRKKADPSKTREAAMGEKVNYDKNGLLKKKNYKSLRNKPKRIKYT